MRTIALSTIVTLFLFGCDSTTDDDGDAGNGGNGGSAGAGGDGGSGGTGGTDEFVAMLSHTFDPQLIDTAEETSDTCQTWVLDNDEPIYVRKIRQTNGGGWHHSNWFFVPEWGYPPNEEVEGPDATTEGTWKCRDRGFREYLAAASGGVFFAQSTQTMTELQAFPDGAALVIPPRSAIIGSIHLLNISGAPLETSMSFEIETAEEEEVEVKLSPFSFAIQDLNIPPAVDGKPTESRTSMMCDLTPAFQSVKKTEVPDFKIYYVLGHYHDWGNFFNLSYEYEDGSLRTIFEIKNSIGEPIGSVIDPPMSNEGARKLRSECGFLNNTDRTLRRGLSEGEMCDFLAYHDADIQIGASGVDNVEMGVDEEGRFVFETQCGGLTGFPASNNE
jgi:hypothetical protein